MKLLLQYGEFKKVRELNNPCDLHSHVEQAFNLGPSTYFLQMFDEEFGEFVDLEDVNSILDKSKIKVILNQSHEEIHKAADMSFNNSLTFTDDEQENCDNRLQDVVVLPQSQLQWPDEVTIPTEKFSTDLLEELESKKILSWDTSRELVGHLARYAYSFKLYPSKAERTEICQALLRIYPHLRNTIGSGLGGWETKLLNKIKKLRQADTSLAVKLNRINSKVPGSKVPRNIHINPKKGELNWAPDHLPGETAESLLLHKRILCEESLKSLENQDDGKISALMDLTYSFRRERINDKVLLVELKEEYPILFQKEQQFEEFRRLTSVHIYKTFLIESSNQGPLLFEIFRKKKKTSEESTLLNNFDKECKDLNTSQQLQAKIQFGFYIIPYLLKEDIDCIFKMVTDDDHTQEFDVTYPKIFLFGELLKSSSFVIVAENTELCRSEDFIEAVCLLMSYYYTLNMDYPSAILNSLKYIQNNVIKIKTGGVPAKVRTLMNKIFNLRQKYN